MNRITPTLAALICGFSLFGCSQGINTTNFEPMTIKFIPTDEQLWNDDKPVFAISSINSKGECVIWHMKAYGLQCIGHEIKECDSKIKTGKGFHEGRDSNEHCQ